jgi:hypothetical protein
MPSSPRKRVASYAAPMIVGLIAAQRAAEHVRTVDFLLLFAGGAAFCVGLAGLIQTLRNRRGAST